MKRLLISLCLALFLPFLMMGHSPKKITATYNEKNKKVKIEVRHPVKNVEKHFVESITIFQGDKEIKKIPFENQTEAEKQVTEIELPGIAKGSEITIHAKCNQMGSKKETLKL